LPAYNRGDLSIEGYLVRILAAICRQNGGEVRIKGELIDTPGDATALLKSWDSRSQELVLSTSMGAFSEVYKIIPEKPGQRELFVQRPVEREETQPPANGGAHRSVVPDDAKLNELEKTLQKRRIAAMLKDEMRRNRTREAE
jgi:hypothetical protein